MSRPGATGISSPAATADPTTRQVGSSWTTVATTIASRTDGESKSIDSIENSDIGQ